MKKQKPITATTPKRDKPPKPEMSFEEAMRRIVQVPPHPKK
ncbi:MAG: hypothetical protein V1799_11385 [bacterium]